MEVVESRCRVCDTTTFDVVRADPIVVCAPCVRRIGTLLLDAERSSEVWLVTVDGDFVVDGDPETRADLAIAYFQMGLHVAAVTEAAKALNGGTSNAAQLLSMLFDRRIARPNALAHLRRVLGRS